MRRIYLDHASQAPVDPQVLSYALPYLHKNVGNPSALHSAGQATREAIEKARERVAALINAENADCIIFTSGATEANNLAIRGSALRNMGRGKRVVASAIEHISVLNPMKELCKHGFELATIPVNSEGHLDLNELENALNADTVLTSIAYASSEIGTIEPIAEISEIVHNQAQYLHVDATAAVGRIPVDVRGDGIDLLTISSNNMCGPQGAGALYVKPGVKLQAILLGGGQEGGLRSGTENAFAIVAMGEAARMARENMEEESDRLRNLRDKLIRAILAIPGTRLTGDPEQRLPNHASFIFPGIEGESILMHLDSAYNITVSTGSACATMTAQPSTVLTAIGLSPEEAQSSIVITLGRNNQPEDIPIIVRAFTETIKKLSAISIS